jgi:hypothetical protein
MERIFLEDRGRWKRGTVVEWPMSTWKTFFTDWEEITAPVDVIAAEALKTASPKRGRGRPRKEVIDG